jgi:U4/U6 small nuclear ribonucleoprotein PRP31
MSTVAEDLLNDFGSSGDEAEDVETSGLELNGDKEDTIGADRDSMDVDDREGAEKDGDDGDEKDLADSLGDPEAAKIKIEKMQLGGVKDVRSVAGLMQTLQPILEVSLSPTQ